MKRIGILILLAISSSAFAQVPQGIAFLQGSLSSTLKPMVGGANFITLNLDWDKGDPPESCGQTSAATYNVEQNLSNPFGIRFESHYGDVGQNDNCADNPLHVRTELSNSGNPWPLTATTGASQDIWKSFWFMAEQPTGCTTLVGGLCLVSSNYFVVDQLHPGNSASVPSSASPAFDIDLPACLGEVAPTGTNGTVCASGPYGSNFQLVVRQCETSLDTCSSLPSAIFVYTMPNFNFGQYYQIRWHAVYSQAGCMLNSNGTVSATCYYPGGSSCSNVTCGQLQVWINGVEVVNYTGIVLGYPETSCPTSNPGTITCPYDKFGIYREKPPNQENIVVHDNSVQFGPTQSSVALPPIGMGAWQ